MSAESDAASRGRHPPAVVAALQREIAPLWRRSRPQSRIATSSGRFIRTRLGGRPAVLGWTGDGGRAAAEGLRALLARQAVSRLIVLGVAGGLSPELAAGQVVVASEIRDASGAAPPPDEHLSRQALATNDAIPGLLFTSQRILSRRRDKADAWQRLGKPRVATVDLETAVWARIAAERHLPFVAIRAVSDAAEEDLPLDFERYRDAHGRLRQSRVALAAAARPALIGALRRLQKRVDAGAERLAAQALAPWATHE